MLQQRESTDAPTTDLFYITRSHRTEGPPLGAPNASPRSHGPGLRVSAKCALGRHAGATNTSALGCGKEFRGRLGSCRRMQTVPRAAAPSVDTNTCVPKVASSQLPEREDNKGLPIMLFLFCLATALAGFSTIVVCFFKNIHSNYTGQHRGPSHWLFGTRQGLQESHAILAHQRHHRQRRSNWLLI